MDDDPLLSQYEEARAHRIAANMARLGERQMRDKMQSKSGSLPLPGARCDTPRAPSSPHTHTHTHRTQNPWASSPRSPPYRSPWRNRERCAEEKRRGGDTRKKRERKEGTRKPGLALLTLSLPPPPTHTLSPAPRARPSRPAPAPPPPAPPSAWPPNHLNGWAWTWPPARTAGRPGCRPRARRRRPGWMRPASPPGGRRCRPAGAPPRPPGGRSTMPPSA